MKVKEIVDALQLKVLAGAGALEREVAGCYVSDLLSDVVGRAPAGAVWVTLHTHKNVVVVAKLKDLACVIVVKGLRPSDEMLAQCEAETIPLLSTQMETFEAAGKLYGLLKNDRNTTD